jgi:hypothetical protein
MPLTASKTGPFFASGSISFNSLRTNFKETGSGSVSASELLRTVDTSNTNPIVPDATENANISSSLNLKLSQFRNTIKYYNLTQGSGDTDLNLNIGDDSASGWNGNLGKTIKKTCYLQGTCGSTNGSPAAYVATSETPKAARNLRIQVAGGVYGYGGQPQGGNGGAALYVNTAGQGTVVVYATGSVYGGGGGGGRGGIGGKGADGSYITTAQRYESVGGAGGRSGGAYYQLCQNVCNNTYGGNAYCQSNCYKTFGQGGCGCTCYSNEQSGDANCQCCWALRDYQYTTYTYGGSGGTGDLGGYGEGYLQTRTNGVSGGNGNASTGTNAGNGGSGGTSGSGGTWGNDGTDGQTGNLGQNGNLNGSANAAPGVGQENGPQAGTSKGFGGAAVGGSGFFVDPSSILSAFKGSYT